MEIVKTPVEGKLIDVMGGSRWEIDVDGNHGRCALVDCMPRLVPEGYTADFAIAQAARTSTGQGTKGLREDTGLIRFLARHKHTTPFEMVEFKFHQVLPIFVARQLIRHRTSNVNEYSLRYAEVKDRFWFPASPEYLRGQSASNKQHTDGSVDLEAAQDYIDHLQMQSAAELLHYQAMIKAGVGRELARVNMPLSLYTEWYWKCDLHNITHFLGLRQDSHAQKEIRDYADAMYTLIKPIVPIAVQAYDDYHELRGGLKLSALDLKALNSNRSRDDLNAVFENTRELGEFVAKAQRVGAVSTAEVATALHADRVKAEEAARKAKAEKTA